MIDRTVKPEQKGAIEFSIDGISKTTLSNSVEMYYFRKSELPIMQMKLTIQAGSIFDAGRHGISNLTSMLVDEGAGGLSGLEISAKLDTLGSILNINTNKDYTTLSLLTLSEHFEESLDIFSKILTEPVFSELDFNRERDRLNAHILQLNNDPAYIASAEINRVIYENTPYQFPPSGLINSVNEIKINEVKNFYAQRYFPAGSFLSIAGNLKKDRVEAKINEYLKSWKGSPGEKNENFAVKSTERQIILIDKPDAAQSEIRLGHFSKGRKSDDFFARTVLNSILGGQFSSRINLNLREDKGYTYGAHSRYIYNKIGSTFLVSTSVQSETTAAAIEQIIIELESIKSNLTREEIEFAKSYLIRSYPSLFETYSQIAANISLLPIYGLGLNYFNEYSKKINKVSYNDVIEAAEENILLNDIVVAVVGKKDILKKDLEDFAAENEFTFKEMATDN